MLRILASPYFMDMDEERSGDEWSKLGVECPTAMQEKVNPQNAKYFLKDRKIFPFFFLFQMPLEAGCRKLVKIHFIGNFRFYKKQFSNGEKLQALEMESLFDHFPIKAN